MTPHAPRPTALSRLGGGGANEFQRHDVRSAVSGSTLAARRAPQQPNRIAEIAPDRIHSQSAFGNTLGEAVLSRYLLRATRVRSVKDAGTGVLQSAPSDDLPGAMFGAPVS